MNPDEYLKWQEDAYSALIRVYTEADTIKILDWFKYIKGSEERDLVGNRIVDSFDCIYQAWNNGSDSSSIYHSMMVRLWVYSPFIVKLKD